MLGSALHRAGIPASAEFAAALEQSAAGFVADEAPTGFAAMLEDLASQCGDDPFMVASMLAETGHGLPAQARSLMVVEQIRSASAVMRDAATLQMLDPDPEVRRATAAALQARVAGARGRQRAKAVKYLLQSVLEQRRERWAEHFLLTALWLKEAPDNAALPWREFAILARALADGHDLSDIALMREIADRTVSVLAFE